MTDKLRDLRQKIDHLDDEILGLVRARLSLSAAISAAKNGSGIFRPGREAQVMHRLCAQAPEIAPATILSIWRQIVSGSIAQQDGTIQLAVHTDSLSTALWHFGDAMRVDECADLDAAMAAMDGGAALAMVPCDLASDVAETLYKAADRFIISRTPLFAVEGVKPSYIIGAHLPDQSGQDQTVFALPQDKGVDLVFGDGSCTNAADAGLPDTAKLIGLIAC